MSVSSLYIKNTILRMVDLERVQTVVWNNEGLRGHGPDMENYTVRESYTSFCRQLELAVRRDIVLRMLDNDRVGVSSAAEDEVGGAAAESLEVRAVIRKTTQDVGEVL